MIMGFGVRKDLLLQVVLEGKLRLKPCLHRDENGIISKKLKTHAVHTAADAAL